MLLGGLGCTSISDSVPSSESLELETTEDLDALLKYERISIFLFCFSVLQFIKMMQVSSIVPFL